jgi:hypothetical protein
MNITQANRRRPSDPRSSGRRVLQRDGGKTGAHHGVHRLDERVEDDRVTRQDLDVALVGVLALDRAQLAAELPDVTKWWPNWGAA